MFITGILVTLAVLIFIVTAWTVIWNIGLSHGNTGSSDKFAWIITLLLVSSTFFLGVMTERYLVADVPQKQEVKNDKNSR